MEQEIMKSMESTISDFIEDYEIIRDRIQTASRRHELKTFVKIKLEEKFGRIWKKKDGEFVD